MKTYLKEAAALAATAGALFLIGCPGASQDGTEPKRDAPAEKPAKRAESEIDVAGLREQAKNLFNGALPAVAELPKDAGYELTDELVDLGRKLYFDTRLSKGGTVSCNTCHALDKFGIDPRGGKVSQGHNDQEGARNSPTVYNAAFHTAGQFWDLRAKTVEEQATMPITNPIEHGFAEGEAGAAEAAEAIKAIEGYPPLFAAAFPGEEDPITLANIGKAIGAFERKLTTPAKFDKWIAGDDAAMSAEEVKGLDAYVKAGCITCHVGYAFGGTQKNKLGLVKPWPYEGEPEDGGVYDLTENDADWLWFKVPGLRNVTETAPYLHDGSEADLANLVKLMALHQAGKELSDAEVNSIVTFLGALTGEIDAEFTKQPELP